MTKHAFGGMNRRDLDHLLITLGGSVLSVPGTGDIYYIHPIFGRSSRANSRRKDAPRHLISFVKRIKRGL